MKNWVKKKAVLLLLGILLMSCKKEHCGSMNAARADGIILDEAAFCVPVGYVIGDREFSASYVPSEGNDQDYVHTWTGTNGFTNMGAPAGNVRGGLYKAPVEGTGEICLTYENLCGDKSDNVCKQMVAVNTPYIYYGFPEALLPDFNTSGSMANTTAFAYNGKGYCVSTGTNGGNSLSYLFEFDPLTEKWSVLDPLPADPGSLGIVKVELVEHTAVVFGNQGVWHLDMPTLTWEEGPLYPGGTRWGAAFTFQYQNEIFVCAAKDPTSILPTDHNFMYAYDMNSKTFSEKAYYPDEGDINGGFTAVLANQILVGGGAEGVSGTSYGEYYTYTPAFDSWTLSNTTSVGRPVLDYVYQDTVFVFNQDFELHYLDPFTQQFVEVDVEPEEWPAANCFSPKINYYDPISAWVSGFVIDHKLHVARAARNSTYDFAPSINRGGVFRLKKL